MATKHPICSPNLPSALIPNEAVVGSFAGLALTPAALFGEHHIGPSGRTENVLTPSLLTASSRKSSSHPSRDLAQHVRHTMVYYLVRFVGVNPSSRFCLANRETVT